MTVWFGATSNHGVVASVEFVLSRVSETVGKEKKKDTNGEEDLFETRNRSDGHDTVTDLSLWKREGGKLERRGRREGVPV